MAKENMFMAAAARRKEEQQFLEEKLKKEALKTVSPQKGKAMEKKVSLNLSLAIDAKNKLVEYANEKHISASALVSYWISEYCK